MFACVFVCVQENSVIIQRKYKTLCTDQKHYLYRYTVKTYRKCNKFIFNLQINNFIADVQFKCKIYITNHVLEGKKKQQLQQITIIMHR